MVRSDTETIAPFSDAYQIEYRPETPGDWTTIPTTVGDALDERAATTGATAVTAASTLTANVIPVGDGARGLADSNITHSAGTLLGVNHLWMTGDIYDDTHDKVIIDLNGQANAVNYVRIQNQATGGGPILSATGSDANVALLYRTQGTTEPITFQNGNADEMLILADVGGTPANEVTITNAATTNAPSIAATGGDTNIDLSLAGKGTGAVALASDLQCDGNAIVGGSSASIDFMEAVGGSTSVRVNTAASYVNYLTLEGNTTGKECHITTVGGDANVDLHIETAGTGVVQIGTELDMAGNAINASSGDIILERGGTELCRWTIPAAPNDKPAYLQGATSLGADDLKNKWFLVHDAVDAAGWMVFQTAYDGSTRHPQTTYRKSRGTPSSPSNLSSGDRIGAVTVSGYAGSAWEWMGSIRWLYESGVSSRCEILAGPSNVYLTLEAGGDVTFETSGCRLSIGGSTHWIEHDATNGLDYNVATGKAHTWEVNNTQEMQMSADIIAFGPSGAPGGSIRWGTAATLDLYGSGTMVISLNGTGLGLFGTTPVGQAAGMTATLTSITHTAPGTPDYALQDLVDSGVGSCFGFATKDEGNTLLSVVANLQTRVNELEAMLDSTTGIGLAA